MFGRDTSLGGVTGSQTTLTPLPRRVGLDPNPSSPVPPRLSFDPRYTRTETRRGPVDPDRRGPTTPCRKFPWRPSRRQSDKCSRPWVVRRHLGPSVRSETLDECRCSVGPVRDGGGPGTRRARRDSTSLCTKGGKVSTPFSLPHPLSGVPGEGRIRVSGLAMRER